ncbi:MAG: hypothetical protein ABS939_17185 [Psychrobacillus sp.]
MTSFFIPKRINVGYQERQGTYTGKLAYIIYFDAKGKLRKEASWDGWRNKEIDNDIIENEPMEGFVLNKKAGGYSTGWNHRQTYVRVYDPRGFEFEITVPNLLYILENATSTKGKGLEGKFVYGWDGKDLVLIPCDAPDYQELVKLNELRHSEKKIGARDLKVGATYRTRENKEWIYMGKFDEYRWGEKKKKPQFWFYYRNDDDGGFCTVASVSGKLVEVVSEDCVADYADIFDKMECRSNYSPIDDTKDEFIPYTLEEIEKAFELTQWGWYKNPSCVYVKTGNQVNLRKGRDGRFYYEYKNPNYNPRNYWNRYSNLNDGKEVDDRYYLRVEFESAEEVIEKLKPLRKRKYLANGKIYSEGY